MSSLSPDLFSLIQMVTMVLRMIVGCVVLAAVLLLFAYGILMMGIVHLKLSRNPDFSRGER